MLTRLHGLRDIGRSTGVARRSLALVLTIALLALSAAAPSPANAQSGAAVGKSGLPVPRFVSLKASRVNVRVGPGQDYRVAWVFTRPGLPIEIIQEFDTWRRVRDSDGSVGWIFHSLLSGKRTGVVTPWGREEPTPIFARPGASVTVAAYLEPGVVAEVERCQDSWCRVSGRRFDGWIQQERLWGVYPDETID